MTREQFAAGKEPQPTSAAIMARLVEEARRTPKPDVRLSSLERLRRSCDDILSGEAAKFARRVDPGAVQRFSHPPLRLYPALVEAYVRLRNREAPEPRTWSGPTASFIRQDEGMRSYIQARLAEEIVARGGQRPRTRKTSIDHSLSQLSFEDQMVVREKIEEGLEAKRKLDLLRASLRSMPAIDVDALITGVMSSNSMATNNSQTLDASDRVRLRQLLARLRDPDEMLEFGLVFIDGRLMMAAAPETELVRRHEFDLLFALAGDSDQVD